jgi:hypothetical protein
MTTRAASSNAARASCWMQRAPPHCLGSGATPEMRSAAAGSHSSTIAEAASRKARGAGSNYLTRAVPETSRAAVRSLTDDANTAMAYPSTPHVLESLTSVHATHLTRWAADSSDSRVDTDSVSRRCKTCPRAARPGMRRQGILRVHRAGSPSAARFGRPAECAGRDVDRHDRRGSSSACSAWANGASQGSLRSIQTSRLGTRSLRKASYRNRIDRWRVRTKARRSRRRPGRIRNV